MSNENMSILKKMILSLIFPFSLLYHCVFFGNDKHNNKIWNYIIYHIRQDYDKNRLVVIGYSFFSFIFISIIYFPLDFIFNKLFLKQIIISYYSNFIEKLGGYLCIVQYYLTVIVLLMVVLLIQLFRKDLRKCYNLCLNAMLVLIIYVLLCLIFIIWDSGFFSIALTISGLIITSLVALELKTKMIYSGKGFLEQLSKHIEYLKCIEPIDEDKKHKLYIISPNIPIGIGLGERKSLFRKLIEDNEHIQFIFICKTFEKYFFNDFDSNNNFGKFLLLKNIDENTNNDMLNYIFDRYCKKIQNLITDKFSEVEGKYGYLNEKKLLEIFKNIQKAKLLDDLENPEIRNILEKAKDIQDIGSIIKSKTLDKLKESIDELLNDNNIWKNAVDSIDELKKITKIESNIESNVEFIQKYNILSKLSPQKCNIDKLSPPNKNDNKNLCGYISTEECVLGTYTNVFNEDGQTLFNGEIITSNEYLDTVRNYIVSIKKEIKTGKDFIDQLYNHIDILSKDNTKHELYIISPYICVGKRLNRGLVDLIKDNIDKIDFIFICKTIQFDTINSYCCEKDMSKKLAYLKDIDKEKNGMLVEMCEDYNINNDDFYDKFNELNELINTIKEILKMKNDNIEMKNNNIKIIQKYDEMYEERIGGYLSKSECVLGKYNYNNFNNINIDFDGELITNINLTEIIKKYMINIEKKIITDGESFMESLNNHIKKLREETSGHKQYLYIISPNITIGHGPKEDLLTTIKKNENIQFKFICKTINYDSLEQYNEANDKNSFLEKIDKTTDSMLDYMYKRYCFNDQFDKFEESIKVLKQILEIEKKHNGNVEIIQRYDEIYRGKNIGGYLSDKECVLGTYKNVDNKNTGKIRFSGETITSPDVIDLIKTNIGIQGQDAVTI